MRKHELSQNFLRSPRVALELIGHSNIRKNDVVVEIGAGSGVFTMALSSRCKRVIAVEKDEATCTVLRRNLAGPRIGNVEVVCADFLGLSEEDFAEVLPSEIGFGSGRYKICGNPPFSISSEILRRFLPGDGDFLRPKAMFLILQKSFAMKLVNVRKDRDGGVFSFDPGFRSKLGVLLGVFYEIRVRKILARTDFTPPSAVDTVFVEFKLREEFLVEEGDFGRFSGFVDEIYDGTDKEGRASGMGLGEIVDKFRGVLCVREL